MAETLELKSLLRSTLSPGRPLSSRSIVLYTSFGVVKGHTAVSSPQFSDGDLAQTEILELIDVTVEHYSSHLPTASFDQLYIRLSDIQAFSVGTHKGQT